MRVLIATLAAWNEPAHTLKGAAAVLAASAVADAAQRLEIMGRTGELAGAKSVSTELETR
jgi:HPt (histidine-containing phosphotransfer) domain-containing protein